MEHLLGLLRVRIKRGVNLAIRDTRSSDPYVILRLGKHLKTRVVKNNLNPEWNENLTFSITDTNIPVKLAVYDKDTFSLDDKMGDAEFEIKTFVEVVRMLLEDPPEGTIVTKVKPSRVVAPTTAQTMELHHWKMEEEARLEETRLAEETTLVIAEQEKAKCKAAIEAAEAAQRITKMEAQKRISVEMKDSQCSVLAMLLTRNAPMF